MAAKEKPDKINSTLWAYGVFATALFVWASVLTFDLGDWPSPHQFPHNNPTANACGTAGAWIVYQIRYVIGDGVFSILLFATVASLFRMMKGEISNLWERCAGLGLVTLCVSASSHLIFTDGQLSLVVGPGGLLGNVLGNLLHNNLEKLGTIIVLVSCLVVGLVFATEGWVLTLPALLTRAGRSSAQSLHRIRTRTAAAIAPSTLTVAEGISARESTELLRAERTEANRQTKKNKPDEEPLAEEEEEAEDEEYEYEYVYEEEEEEQDDEVAPEEKTKARAAARALVAPKVNFPTAQKMARAEAYPRQIENWTLPSLELLNEPEYTFNKEQEVIVREQAKVLESTLEEFRVDARVVEIDTGPVITMFELKIGAGIKVSQIASLSNDIARALKAHAIRVVAPISGKNTVGIEVPNQKKETVRLRELLTLAGKKATKMGLPLFLGKDAGGAALVADLTKMPHALIAGTTGSGKSVCINSVILSLLMTKRPDHVKMILVDPKMVEMSQFKDVPHLMCPIITDMLKAEKILEWAVTKMEERYAILAEARVRDISSYNHLGKDELFRRIKPQNELEEARISTHLPFILIVIDELADLMMTSAKEVEHHLSRLAQKSRAVGIHIIVATQRPEAKVVTGLIKSNLPSRVCFRVASRMDSRIVLDQNGGEVLLGQGDMLFLPPGAHKLIRAQGTYLEDEEINAVLDDLADRAKPEFHPELMRIKAPGAEADLSLRDPLFDEAVQIVLESRRGSVSLLQRRLSVGYSRSSRLVDQMAEAGIVGEYKGSQAREVMMTLDEWEAMKAQVAADIKEGYAADEDEDDDGEVPALIDDTDIRG